MASSQFCSSPDPYQFKTLAVQHSAGQPKVLEVALNRPDRLNALDENMFMDLTRCFDIADTDADVHCVVLHGGSCRLFCAGIDLLSSGVGKGGTGEQKLDASRIALRSNSKIIKAQEAVSCIERCRKPVVVALHGAIIGGGIDIASACDVRFCSEDAYFKIAEVNIGIAADLGTLQQLPKIVHNDSMVREFALTGGSFSAADAKKLGFVSSVCRDRQECLERARDVASQIASKSPIAVMGAKVSLNYSRDHTLQEGLDHIKMWNTLHVQSEDLPRSVQAVMTKGQATYSRL